MRRIVPALALLVFLCLPIDVLGHDGGGRLEVAPETVVAGLPVTIRGVGMGDAEAIRLAVVDGDGSTVELGSFASGDGAAFQTVIAIPAVDPGTYVVCATLPDGDRVEAMVVIGAAPPPAGELRGEDESLLQPMPIASAGPAVSAPQAPVGSPASEPPAPAAAPTPLATEPSAPVAVPAPLLASLVLAVVAGMVGVGVARRRRSRP